MAKIEGSVKIDRPVEEVFDFMRTFENDTKWQPEVIETRLEGPLGVGSKVVVRRKVMGREMEAMAEITEYEPPHKMGMRSTSGPFPFEGGYSLEEADGGTLVRFHGDLQPGGIFKVAEGVVTKQMQKEFEGNLATLKALLEGGS